MEIPEELVKKFKDAVRVEEERYERQLAKKMSTVQYKRRKLDKDVRRYIKGCKRVIRGSEVDRIARRHGYHILG